MIDSVSQEEALYWCINTLSHPWCQQLLGVTTMCRNTSQTCDMGWHNTAAVSVKQVRDTACCNTCFEMNTMPVICNQIRTWLDPCGVRWQCVESKPRLTGACRVPGPGSLTFQVKSFPQRHARYWFNWPERAVQQSSEAHLRNGPSIHGSCTALNALSLIKHFTEMSSSSC